MKYFLSVVVAFLVIKLSNKSFGQQKDTLKNTPANTYYQQKLGVDQAEATQCGDIKLISL
ncbi:hypothetical protein A0256_18765 [Mucilaginibacter sp. PAMC 26640]|nr:hypothetical protein A0256_18765 [Mucilaginibacter sp. PAMC 26640]